MADRLPALDEPDHSDEWTYAYLDGELSEVEKSAFEEHMKSHAECREEVETMRVALPVFADTLMEDGPPRTGAEYAALAKAAEEKLKAEGSPHPALSPGRGEGVARKWRPAWTWGGAGFAALAGAAAALLFLVQQLPGVEPQLMQVGEMAPIAEVPVPLPLPPTMLELSATVRFGQLVVELPREPGDVYTAVALVDAKKKLWLAQAGDGHDPGCEAGCGALKLRIKLDRLAPGPVTVAVVVSTVPIATTRLGHWLREAATAVPQGLGARAYGVATGER